MEAHVLRYVRDAKLQVHFLDQYTQHPSPPVAHGQNGSKTSQRVERWKKEKLIGSGASGTVWLERCVSPVTKVGRKQLRAVKQIPRQFTQDDNSPPEYWREIEAIMKFSEPQFERYFVKSDGWYDDLDYIYITMEYLALGNLQAHIRGSPLHELDSVNIISQLLHGLGWMHEIGYAHRDLNPQNVFVVSRNPIWWVKIGDFGISKRITDGSTQLRTLGGTPGYIAPEILAEWNGYSNRGPGDGLQFVYTFAVDVWALGAMTYRMLAGQPAFDTWDCLRKYIERRIELPTNRLDALGVSTEAADFASHLMAFKAKDRPSARDALKHAWLSSALDPTKFSMESSNLPAERMIPIQGPSSADSSIDLAPGRWSDTWTTGRMCANSNDGLEDPEPRELSTVDQHAMVPSSASERLPFSTEELRGSHNPTSEFGRVTRAYPSWGPGFISCLQFSRGGELIALSGVWGDDDALTVLWNAPTGAVFGKLVEETQGFGSRIYNQLRATASNALAFSYDSTLLATGFQHGEICVWNLENGRELVRVKVEKGGFAALAVSSAVRLVAGGGRVGIIKLWDCFTGAACGDLTCDGPDCTILNFFSDGRKLVSGSTDGSIRIWNTLQKTLQMELAVSGTSICSMALSDDNELIAAGYSNSDIRIWSTITGITTSQLTSFDRVPEYLALSPDNSYLAVVTYEESKTWNPDWVIRIWDIQSQAVHRELPMSNSRPETFRAITFGKERNIVMMATDLWITSVWNLETQELHRKVQGHRPLTILDAPPQIPLFELVRKGYSKLSQYFSNT